MEKEKLHQILQKFKNGTYSLDEVFEQLKILPFSDLGHSKIDHHRTLRIGFPEVVYGEGKSVEHLLSIIKELAGKYKNFIITRVSQEKAEEILKKFPGPVYHESAKILTAKPAKKQKKKEVAVLCAGTSDYSVAEEAAVTLEILGKGVERIYDVGVSGIHRIVPHLEKLNKCKILIVIAGMEGALPGVIAGMTGKPVIGVPTSVGYGTNLKGFAPLLTMLNSCAPIVAVNIDNGFGAAFFAWLVLKK
ncbi:MAG TPA: nickel pincer cofactor biosynthesis protein LarB [bacterium]|nr:nickel pincer cofactor biosynthesis protein LarB [bacterium]HOL35600.1 nickel pincer cofactor biosynthesis protein LarB [bacterium]HPP08816.1 nickel pincer cofactor biosynthesis protein LarB [bacterium]